MSFIVFLIGLIAIVIIGISLLRIPTKYQQLHPTENIGNHDSQDKEKGKIKAKFIKNFYFILLPLVIGISYVLSDFIISNESILSVIVTASAFIVAVISGFLINSYYNVNQLRWEKVERFSELQNSLKPYAEAFYWLVHDLTRKHKLNYRFPESIKTLEHDTEWNWSNDESVAVRFVRYLSDFAGNPYDMPDFELSRKIISKDRLDEMYEYVIMAGGLLGRYKHFKYILKAFKLKDTNDLDEVIIADSQFVEIHAKKISKTGEDYRTLGFWEAKIDEASEILARMKANGEFVYSFNIYEIQRLGLNLLFISIFGILLPITILMLDSTIENYKSFVTILSAVGFVTYFSLGIMRIYKKLSSTKLSYS